MTMIRPDLMAHQYAATVRADLRTQPMDLRTQPMVFDSGSVPLGVECATPAPEPGAVLDDAQLEALWRRRQTPMPRANTDEGYVSRPVPLNQERMSSRMVGEAAANALALCAVLAIAVAAAWHFVARLAS